MKTRYLTLLTALAFIGFSVPAVAHNCKHHIDKNHEHCDKSGGSVKNTYSVVIEGDIDGRSGDDNWVRGFVGKKSIGLNDAGPANLDVGEFANLNFFTATASDNPPGHSVTMAQPASPRLTFRYIRR